MLLSMTKFQTTQLSISVDLTITLKEMTFGELVLKPKLLHLHALISELLSLTVVIFFKTGGSGESSLETVW